MKKKMLSEKSPAEQLDDNNRKKNPENYWEISILYYSNRPHNVDGTDLDGDGTYQYDNKNRETNKLIFRLQRDIPRHSTRIQRKWNDSPYLFG